MTDLQIRYWTLQEQARANRAQEGIGQYKNLISLKDVESNVQYREAATRKTEQEINKVLAEVEKIKADTKLSEMERQKRLSETARSWQQFAISILDPFGIIQSFGQGLSGSFGKAAGKSLLA